MSEKPLHPDIVKFISSLSLIEKTLCQYHELFWVDKIMKIQLIARLSDDHCIDNFLGLFGGIGSLNDLVLDAPKIVNEEFRRELNKAYAIAKKLE